MTTAALNYSAISTPVTCSMHRDCRRAVSHVDSKGMFFCAKCAEQRRAWKSCRKLRPVEVNLLDCDVFEVSFLVKVRGEHGCSVMSTLGFAVAQAECYMASTPGRVVDISETRTCGHCHGQRGLKRCPFCKDVEPEDVLLQTFSPEAV